MSGEYVTFNQNDEIGIAANEALFEQFDDKIGRLGGLKLLII